VTALGVAACAVLGLVVGLALNVVIDRVPPRQKLLPLRFHCPRCPEDVEDRPGLPVAAWLRPGAPCPICGQRLPARYFLVPVANAVLFATIAVRLGADWALPAYLLFFAVLLAISVVDLQLQIIPNRIVYPAIFASVPLLAVAALGQHDWWPLERALISAAAAWFALLVIHLVSPGGMGFGDVRLSFLLGLFLGWLGYGHVLTGLFLGFLLGAVVGLLLVALRLRKRTDHVPFGPFLAVGAALAILVGDPVVHLLVRGG
jgi:leader peptidase (prepilin peptidase)/N-methyltransferase